MNVNLLFGAVLALASSSAFAQDASDLPPGWPRPGATLLIENDRGAAFNVVYPKDVVTPFHRHRYDFAGLDLNTSTIRVLQADGTARNGVTLKNRMWYLPKDLTHSEMSVVAPGRHTVVIDIKEKSLPEAVNKTSFPSNKYANYQNLVVDNEKVAIWDVAWAHQGERISSFNTRDVFLAIAEPGMLSIETEGEPAVVKHFGEGEAIFLPGGKVRTITSAGGVPHAMIVELK